MNTLFWLPSLHCKGYNTWVLLLQSDEKTKIFLHEFLSGTKPSHSKLFKKLLIIVSAPKGQIGSSRPN